VHDLDEAKSNAIDEGFARMELGGSYNPHILDGIDNDKKMMMILLLVLFVMTRVNLIG
jgi:hypothetical protein